MRQWWGMRRRGHTLSSKTQLVANDTTFGARGLGLRLQTRGHNGLNYGLNGSASQSTNKDPCACTWEHMHSGTRTVAHAGTCTHRHTQAKYHTLNTDPVCESSELALNPRGTYAKAMRWTPPPVFSNRDPNYEAVQMGDCQSYPTYSTWREQLREMNLYKKKQTSH